MMIYGLDDLADVEARLKVVYAKWHEPTFTKRLLDEDIPALCATVRHLMAENTRLTKGLATTKQHRNDLLEEIRLLERKKP